MALTKKQLAKALSRDFETTLGSYASGDARNLKKQCDRLANFAYIAMKHLEDNGIQDFVLLKHDDLADWWKDHKAALRQDQLEKEAKLRRYEIRERALSRLTDEEKEALGLRKK